MRFSTVLLGLLAASCAGTGDAPEVSTARETIRDASTLHLEFTCHVGAGIMTVEQKGILYLAPGNKFRLEIRTPVDPRGDSVAVCDGTRVSYKRAGGPEGEVEAPSDLSAFLKEVSVLEPLQSFFVVFNRPSQLEEAVAEELSRLRESRGVLLGDEELAGRPVKKFEVKSGEGVFSGSKRYIFLSTDSPAFFRKSMAFEGHGAKYLLTENWTSVRVDPELEPSLFQLK